MVIKDKSAYIVFCKRNETSLPVFYSTSWLDTVCDDKWDVLIYKNQNEIVAALPFHSKKKFGLSAVIMPLLTPYLGVWFDENINDIDKENIEKELLSRLPKAFYYNLAFHHSNNNKHLWEAKGYNSKTRYTHTINAQNIDIVRNNFTNTTKAHIRSAERNLTIIKNDDIESLWKNIISSFNKNEYEASFNIGSIERIFNNKSTNATIYHAIDYQSKSHASVMTIEDSNTVYHLLSGRSIEAARGAVALIINQTLNDAMEIGKNYDFEGSSIPSIATFFKSFGAKEVTFPQVYKSYNKITDSLLKMIGKF